MYTYDIVIIGAGVAGAAIARRAAEIFPHHSIAVLERNVRAGLETSSKNSGVLHSGFHQKPNSLKARFAKMGHVLARDFARENSVPLLETGMLITVPSSEMRHPSLWYEGSASMYNLFRRGKKHGIDFEILTNIGIKKLEPNIHGALGVFIPGVSVIDSRQFVQTLATHAEKAGVHFFYGNIVEDIHFEKNRTIITTAQADICATVVINAAGLYADDIGNLALGYERYKQYPWRGEYYEVINPEKKNLVQRLVYPVVSSNHPGKGVHFGPRPDGRLFLGPNAKRVPSKTFYDEDRTPKEEFLKIANSFGVCLEPEDIEWSYAGIRPKTSDQAEEDDFHIGINSRNPLFISLIGIESPGISSGMALAKFVCARPEVLNALR